MKEKKKKIGIFRERKTKKKDAWEERVGLSVGLKEDEKIIKNTIEKEKGEGKKK